jgi:hypothetical protein
MCTLGSLNFSFKQIDEFVVELEQKIYEEQIFLKLAALASILGWEPIGCSSVVFLRDLSTGNNFSDSGNRPTE